MNPSSTQGWNIDPSKCATNIVNPIRRIVDTMKLTPNPEKKLIRLSIGDPTVSGELLTSKEIIQAVVDAATSSHHNGYPNSAGTEVARQAVADYMSKPGSPVAFTDVVLTSGCSQALEYIFLLIANPGDTILIPRPGFSLYKVLADSVGIKVLYYDLLPEKGWEIDLASLRSLLDDSVKAIVVNSPSNPCGAVFSKKHMEDIIDICATYKVPIISDEVYQNIVFEGHTHYSFSEVSKNVPVFTVSSLAKRFLVPGWRLGWLVVHDRSDAISQKFRNGLISLTQRTLGPCSLLQAALPKILQDTTLAYPCTELYERNARTGYKILASAPGLEPVKPTGAMYMLVGITIDMFPMFKSDVDFTEALISEESVFSLPAKCFEYPNYFRIVLCLPSEQMEEACKRIKSFCEKHITRSLPILTASENIHCAKTSCDRN